MATDTQAINLGNMREIVRGGWGDLSEPILEGWQRASARVTWRWEKKLRYQTEMVLVFGNREKVNETRTGWTMSKGSTPRMRLETLTGAWAWQRAVEPQRGVKFLSQEVEVWTSGRKKNLPSDLLLFIEVIWFWACDPASILQFSFLFFIQGGLKILITARHSLQTRTTTHKHTANLANHFRGQCCSSGLVFHLHVTSGLPQAEREAVYEKVWAEWKEPGIKEPGISDRLKGKGAKFVLNAHPI